VLQDAAVIHSIAAIAMNNTCLNIFAPLRFLDLTLRAQSHEFQQVAVDAITRFLLETLFETVQFTVGEVSHSTAIAADQVMMMFPRALALEITAAGIPYMDLTEQAVFLKQVQRTIYGDQADIGIFLMQPYMDVSRPQVLSAVAQHRNNCLPLRGQLEAPLPELRRNILPDHIYIAK